MIRDRHRIGDYSEITRASALDALRGFGEHIERQIRRASASRRRGRAADDGEALGG